MKTIQDIKNNFRIAKNKHFLSLPKLVKIPQPFKARTRKSRLKFNMYLRFEMFAPTNFTYNMPYKTTRPLKTYKGSWTWVGFRSIRGDSENII